MFFKINKDMRDKIEIIVKEISNKFPEKIKSTLRCNNQNHKEVEKEYKSSYNMKVKDNFFTTNPIYSNKILK